MRIKSALHSVLHAVIHFGTLGVIEAIDCTYQVTSDTTNAFKTNTFTKFGLFLF